MTTRTRLMTTLIAIIIITAAVAVAKIAGSPALAVGVAVVGIVGYCVLVAISNRRLHRQH